MSSVALMLPPGFGLVVLEAVLMSLQCFGEGMAVFKLRQRLFPRSFLDRHFPDSRQTLIDGYPDSGGGRISDKLSYDDWLDLNNAQRAHGNYVEQLPVAITFSVVSGLTYPRLTAVAGAAYIVGRQLYATGYRKRGPTGRFFGVAILDIGLIVLLGGSLLSTWHIGGGVDGWQRSFKALLGQY